MSACCWGTDNGVRVVKTLTMECALWSTDDGMFGLVVIGGIGWRRCLVMMGIPELGGISTAAKATDRATIAPAPTRWRL